MHFPRQTAPLEAKPQEFSPRLSGPCHRASLTGTAPSPRFLGSLTTYSRPGLAGNPESGESARISAPAPRAAAGRGGNRGGPAAPARGQAGSLAPPEEFAPPPAQAAHVAPAPRRRLAPAAHSLPSRAVTSAAGAGVRPPEAPHPSTLAREPCLPSPGAGPPKGRTTVGEIGQQ